MTNEERIEQLRQEIVELWQQSDLCHDKAKILCDERERLIVDVIEADHLLADTSWTIKQKGKSFSLEYNGLDEEIQPILDLARPDISPWIEFDPGIELTIDGGNISMYFEHCKQLVPFAKKHKMKLSGKGLTDNLADLKRQVSALEDAIHILEL